MMKLIYDLFGLKIENLVMCETWNNFLTFSYLHEIRHHHLNLTSSLIELWISDREPAPHVKSWTWIAIFKETTDLTSVPRNPIGRNWFSRNTVTIQLCLLCLIWLSKYSSESCYDSIPTKCFHLIQRFALEYSRSHLDYRAKSQDWRIFVIILWHPNDHGV